MRNPYARPHLDMGHTDLDWSRLMEKVKQYLQAHPEQAEVPDSEIRQLDPSLSDDRVWNHLQASL